MDNNMSQVLASISPELQKEAIQFVSKITAQPTKEIGALMTDTVRYWRFKNQLKILQKSKKKLQKLGVNPKEVPIKFIVPFLEGCSLEEEESMQEKWSSLLSNAVNPENENYILPSYIDILKQLSPTEAKLLDILFNIYDKGEFYLHFIYSYESTLEIYKKNELRKYECLRELRQLNINTKKICIYIENFLRLKLLEYTWTESLISLLITKINSNKTISVNDNLNMYIDKVQFTTLGAEFIKACRSY